MKILRTYADTGAMGGQNFYPGIGMRGEKSAPHEKTQLQSSGDSISLSAEARQMLESGEDAVSVCPQDATYDQNGNVTRQFDNLQNELRQLSASVMGTSQGAALLAGISSIKTQLAGLKAMV